MIALYCIGGLLALIVLVLSSPVTVHFVLEKRNVQLVMRVWGIPTTLLPRPEKETDVEGATSSNEEKRKKREKKFRLSDLQTSLKEDGIGAMLRMIKDVIRIGKSSFGKALRAVTIKRLVLQMRISGADAAAAAQNYGKVCAAFYPLFSAVSSMVRIQKQEVDLRADFLEEGTAVYADIAARISLWRLVGAALTTGVSLLRLYMDGNRKDGKTNE